MDTKFQTITVPAVASAPAPVTLTTVPATNTLSNDEKDIIAQREREAHEATQLAAKKESAKWNDIGLAVKRTKEEALAEAHRAQMEANALKIQLKQKEEEIAAFKIQARTLEEHERDYRARGETAGQPPAFIDRVKSSWEGVKEKFATTTTDVGQKADEAGAATSETIAGWKEGIGAKMEQLGESLHAKGRTTKVHAVKEKEQALERKAELESQAIINKQNKEFGAATTTTTNTTTTTAPTTTISDFVNDAKTVGPTTTIGQFNKPDTKFNSGSSGTSTLSSAPSTSLPIDNSKQFNANSDYLGGAPAQQQTNLNSNDKMKYTFNKDTFGTGHVDLDSQARELEKEHHRHDVHHHDKHITL